MNLNFYTNIYSPSESEEPVPQEYQPLLLNWMTPQYSGYDKNSVLIQHYISPKFGVYLVNSNLTEGGVFYTQLNKDWCALQYMIEGESIISPSGMVPYRVKRHHISPLPCGEENIAVHTFMANTRFLQLHMHKTVFKEWNIDPNSWESMLRQWNAYAEENTIYKSIGQDPRITFWIKKLLQNKQTERDSSNELPTIFRNLITLYLELKADAAYLASLTVKPTYKYMLDIWKTMRAKPDKTKFKLENLAKEYHRTPKNISLHYKFIFGEAISDALHKSCMNRAVYWLSNTDRNLTSIAKDLGYLNKTSLYNALKDRFDITVEEIRKMHY